MVIPVLCGDKWHPADIVKKGLKGLEGLEYSFNFLENAQDISLELFKDNRIIILSKSNNVSQEDESPWLDQELDLAIKDYVEAGGSLLALHSGTSDYEDSKDLKPLLGGVFAHHPDQCPVKVSFSNDHLLTKGCSDFTLVDEHYFMDMNDDNIDVFVTTESEHGSQPGGWIKKQGKGRVCVITPGHNLEVWLEPSFQRLLKNAIGWCLG